MRFSVLIITKNKLDQNQVNSQFQALAGKCHDFEILVAEGDNPSLQRNALAKVARGEFLLFLDNDSVPDKKIFDYYCEAIRNYPDVQIVGGPSLLDQNETLINVLSTLFFSSTIGIGPLKSRYNSIGELRTAKDSDLILCNMLIRKDFFLNSQGFNRNHYPGEENEYVKRVSKDVRIMYQPKAIVSRIARQSMMEFVEQMFGYGKGRAKHLNPIKNSEEVLFLVPMFFSLFIIAIVSSLPQSKFLFSLVIWGYLITVFIYLLYEFRRMKIRGSAYVYLLAPIFFLAGHFFYGMGILFGLIKHRLLKRFFSKERELSFVKISRLKDL